MRAVLIVNPNSTNQTPALFSRVIPRLRKVPGLQLVALFTHYSGHARDICAMLADGYDFESNGTRQPVDVVIAVGGDGTVNEVINGLLGDSGKPVEQLGKRPRLAVIPTGSANVFARALGFPAEPIHATEVLAETIAAEEYRTIDLGTWDDKWFAVNAGFGIDAEVIAGVERARRRGFAATPLRYLRVALHAWRLTRKYPPRIDVTARDRNGNDFRRTALPLCVASNTNPWTFLGPLPVVTNPRNSFDLGLSLFALSSLDGIGGALSMMHLVGLGKRPWVQHLVDRRTLTFDDAMQVELDCHEPRRFQVDGEYVGTLSSVTLGAVPKAIEVYAPERTIKPTPISTLRWIVGFFDIRI